jgi:hypothetical protein
VKVVIRPVTKQDQGIIFSTWLKGQYFGSDYWGSMDQDTYFKEYGQHIQNLLNMPGTKIDCAVLEEAPQVVIGYIVYNDQELYWGYVKRDFRKKSILNTLLKDMDFVNYSGITPVGFAIAKRKKLLFNPL